VKLWTLMGMTIALVAAPALASPITDLMPRGKSSAMPADLSVVPVGEGVPGSSWSQGWHISGGPSFDFIAVRVADTTLQMPGLNTFSAAGWSEVFRNSAATISGASGPGTSDLSFVSRFEGDINDATALDLVIFAGTNLLFAGSFVWQPLNSEWTSGAVGWTPLRSDFAVIPLPSAGLTGLAGLLVVALRRRR
jgi:hypothetical protein